MATRNIELTFTGWVGAAPSFYANSPGKAEKAFCSFPLIHTPRYRDAQGNWQTGPSLRVNVKCWGWPAYYTSHSVRVGDPLIVHGRLNRTVWEDDQGTKHYGLELAASSLGHDLALGESAYIRMQGPNPKNQRDLKRREQLFPGDSKSSTLQISANADPDGDFEQVLSDLSYQMVDPETGEVIGEVTSQARHSQSGISPAADLEAAHKVADNDSPPTSAEFILDQDTGSKSTNQPDSTDTQIQAA